MKTGQRAIEKILVVDDEMINRIVAVGILEKAGYSCYEAENGDSALNICDKEEVDMILLDIMMPGMSGYEVCARVREDQSEEDLPVLFATAMNLEEAQEESYKCGGNGIISKPLTMKKLIKEIDRIASNMECQ